MRPISEATPLPSTVYRSKRRGKVRIKFPQFSPPNREKEKDTHGREFGKMATESQMTLQKKIVETSGGIRQGLCIGCGGVATPVMRAETTSLSFQSGRDTFDGDRTPAKTDDQPAFDARDGQERTSQVDTGRQVAQSACLLEWPLYRIG
ncbi:hypothetical protein HPB50_005255 [Hyalomma asiaticum]|uniref:Uncharacterized protein n=1 Tax=Hyalomma asiaticum TaxID=266040 RepID=A0ACB7T0G2_HYAAI|nr:hypothetical protein HPB50_005255 [Hyalomma asiaticum]